MKQTFANLLASIVLSGVVLVFTAFLLSAFDTFWSETVDRIGTIGVWLIAVPLLVALVITILVEIGNLFFPHL